MNVYNFFLFAYVILIFESTNVSADVDASLISVPGQCPFHPCFDGQLPLYDPVLCGGNACSKCQFCSSGPYQTVCNLCPPSADPSVEPSNAPSSAPSSTPSFNPSRNPSSTPSSVPSVSPSRKPSVTPSVTPSSAPSNQPTNRPSSNPSVTPSVTPSSAPSIQPSIRPSVTPSLQPSHSPSISPSISPSASPSVQPTNRPSIIPSSAPSVQPSRSPSVAPSVPPSVNPSAVPIVQPTNRPSITPSVAPSVQPSRSPSVAPTIVPSATPSVQPSHSPSVTPSVSPSVRPTIRPSVAPTVVPSATPSVQPSRSPSVTPSVAPSVTPSLRPSNRPSIKPSVSPSTVPSVQPSHSPSLAPSVAPSVLPSVLPSITPSAAPVVAPSSDPSVAPSVGPSTEPSTEPSVAPSASPSVDPTEFSSVLPSSQPTGQPSTEPSSQPSGQPSVEPTSQPSAQPSMQPNSGPSAEPTSQPSAEPSCIPSSKPTSPTVEPSIEPSISLAPSFVFCPEYNGRIVRCSGCQFCPDLSLCSNAPPGCTGHPTFAPVPAVTAPPGASYALCQAFNGQPPQKCTGCQYCLDGSLCPIASSFNCSNHPTFAPVTMFPSSSKAPTDAPIDTPTMEPSSEPSIVPSGAPSTSFEPSVSAAPTRAPLPKPTKRPSRAPTLAPLFFTPPSLLASPSPTRKVSTGLITVLQLLQNVSASAFKNPPASAALGVPLSSSIIIFVDLVLAELAAFDIQSVQVQTYTDSGPPMATLLEFQILFSAPGSTNLATFNQMKSVYLNDVNSGNFSAALVRQSKLVGGNLGHCTSSQVISMTLTLLTSTTKPSGGPVFQNVNNPDSSANTLGAGIVAVIIILSVFGMLCLFYLTTDFIFAKWPATARLAKKGLGGGKPVPPAGKPKGMLNSGKTAAESPRVASSDSSRRQSSYFKDGDIPEPALREENSTSFTEEYGDPYLYKKSSSELFRRPASTHFGGRLRVDEDLFDEENPEIFKKEKPVTEPPAWLLDSGTQGGGRETKTVELDEKRPHSVTM